MIELGFLVYIKNGAFWAEHKTSKTKIQPIFWDPYAFRPNTILNDIPEGQKLMAKISFHKEDIYNDIIDIHHTKVIYPFKIKIILPTGIEKSYLNIR